jgi:uncharacterized protein YfiM (DUF2279 family)
MRKSRLDWEAIRRDWELNQWTSRELGEKYSCSHTAINARAAADGWQKNLAKQVANRTAAMLAAGEDLSLADRELVEESARKRVDIVRTHQGELKDIADDIKTIRGLLRKKLEAINKSGMTASDKQLDVIARLNESLVRATAKLQDMERKAHGLDKPADGAGDDPINDDELIDAIGELLHSRGHSAGGSEPNA